jgi:hypothetical protein
MLTAALNVREGPAQQQQPHEVNSPEPQLNHPNTAAGRTLTVALKNWRLLTDAERNLENRTSLMSYKPCWHIQTGSTGVNLTIHNKKYDVNKSKAVHRLLVGGQGLRGGDPIETPVATAGTCCVHCLREGRAVVETLQHVTFQCNAYNMIRHSVQNLLQDHCRDASLLCRDRWTWN